MHLETIATDLNRLRLYVARCVLPDASCVSPVLKGVTNIHSFWAVDWRRANPVAPYRNIVKNFDQLSPDMQVETVRYINSLFTGDDIEALRQMLLQRYGTELEAIEVEYPLSYDDYIQGDEGLASKFCACITFKAEEYKLPATMYAYVAWNELGLGKWGRGLQLLEERRPKSVRPS